MVKKLILSAFKAFGFQIVRNPTMKQIVHYNDEMKLGLARFSALKYPINTIIDVGAAEGGWSVSANYFWPEASFLLFEPLNERRTQLESLALRIPRFQFVSCAAGAGDGKVRFVVSDDLDGSGVASEDEQGTIRTVDVTSIQKEIKIRALNGPFIVKLDTHGFEVPIIEGCFEILPEINLFVIECYGFQIAPQSLLFWEMCQYMDSIGFRLFDIVDVMHRKKDNAFWQCDAFFIPKHHLIFKDNRFS